MDIIQGFIETGNAGKSGWRIVNNKGALGVVNKRTSNVSYSILNNGVIAAGSNFINSYSTTPAPTITSSPAATTTGTTGAYTYQVFTYTSETAGAGTGQSLYTITAPAGGITCDILMVGGGGGGGCDRAGGGGSGSLILSINNILSGTYTIRVGNGGTGSASSFANGINGFDTQIVNSGGTVIFRAKGGGAGGTLASVGIDGGSGGGASSQNGGLGGNYVSTNIVNGITTGPVVTTTYGVYGNRGGRNITDFTGGYDNLDGAGGGGIGEGGSTSGALQIVDSQFVANNGGKGGDGLYFVTINGKIYNFKNDFNVNGIQDGTTGNYFIGGGGGGGDCNAGIAGAGGKGGGGKGGELDENGVSASGFGSGGGGGGGRSSGAISVRAGGNGGSGIIIIRYLTSTASTSSSISLIQEPNLNIITNYVGSSSSGGSSQWTSAGTKIYYNTSNVGIGTIDPIAPLHIYNTSNSRLLLDTATTGTATLEFRRGAGGDALNDYRFINDTNSTLKLQYENSAQIFGNAIADLAWFSSNETIIHKNTTINGRVGIGTAYNTTIPSRTLDIVGDANISGVLTVGSFSAASATITNSITSNTSLNITNGFVATIPNEISVVGATSTIIGTTERCISFPYSGTAATKDYTFTTTEALVCDILVVGGGGGGSAGGGGAGGYVYLTNISLSSGTSYTATVGNGGTGATLSSNGNQGANSSFIGGSLSYTAFGGGGGGGNTNLAPAHTAGQVGSYGGNGHDQTTTQSYTSTQGNRGGRALSGGSGSGGGGGGANQVGGDAVLVAGLSSQATLPTITPYYRGGQGGNGIANTITGTSIFYAGGGTAGANTNFDTDTSTQTAPLGGGGIGARANNANGGNGTDGLGGGGGGGDWERTAGTRGGSGIIIIRYRRIANQSAAIELTAVSSIPIIEPIAKGVKQYPETPSTNANSWTDNGFTVVCKTTSSYSPTYDVFNLFENTLNTYYHSTLLFNASSPFNFTGSTTFKGFNSLTISIDLGRSIYIRSMRIAPWRDLPTTAVPGVFKIYASNDSASWNDNNHSSWTEIHSQTTSLTFAANTYTTFGNFSSINTPYRYFAMVVYNLSGNYSYLVMSEWDIFGTYDMTPVVINSDYKHLSYTHSGGTETQTSYTVNFPENTLCDILVVGGGGAGGSRSGSGGGAGSLIYQRNIQLSGSYSINVGRGGKGIVATTGNTGESGIDSSFGSIILAKGGGGGGGWGGAGGTGGSGGGNSGDNPSTTRSIAVTTNIPTGAYGNAGGLSISTGGIWAGSGGGGAGSRGYDGTSTLCGNGGDGLSIDITGTYKFYAAGGGGSAYNSSTNFGLGGSSIGGNGNSIGIAFDGTPNTGSGGGGAGATGSTNAFLGGSGGSGIVIIRYKSTKLANQTYKLGNYSGDFKIISSVSNTDTEYIRITTAGAITNPTGTASWNIGSDRRIKENIERASYDKCYENINKLELNCFNYIEGFNTVNKDKTQLGFIAQEVSDIFPKSISTQEYNTDTLSIPNLMSIDVSQINYALYGAVKKLIEINNEKDARIITLKNRINKLKNLLTNSYEATTSNIIVIEDTTSNIPADTIILDTTSSNIPADIIILDATTSNIPADTIILDETTSNIPADTIILDATTSNIPADIIILDTISSNIPADTIILDETTSNIPSNE